MVQDDCATRLVAEAMLSALKATLKGTQHEDVPLVASVAPARCGGREGPDSYVEVAAGALRERDVSEIQPFAPPKRNGAGVWRLAQSRDSIRIAAQFGRAIEAGASESDCFRVSHKILRNRGLPRLVGWGNQKV